MRARRVLHVALTHPADSPRIYYKEVGTLIEAGFDLRVAAQPPAGGEISIDCVLLPKLGTKALFLYSLVAPFRLVKDLLWADIVHAHDPFSAFPMGIAARVLGVVMIYDIAEYWDELMARGSGGVRMWIVIRLSRFWDYCAIRLANGILAVNEDIADKARLYGKPVALTVHPPLKSLFRRKVKLPKSVIYVGNLTCDRGILDLIDAVNKLARNDPEITLTIAGSINDPAVGQRLEKEKNSPHIKYLGRLPHPQALELMAGCQLGVIPLHNTKRYALSVPVKLYEYVLSGAPVICSDVGPMADFVRQHECGAVYPVGDVDALAGAIAERFADKERMKTETQNCEKAGKGIDGWEEHGGKKLLSLYDQLT